MLLRRLVGSCFLLCFLFFGTMTAVGRMLPASRGPVPEELDEQWQPGLSDVRSVDDAMRVLPRYVAQERGSREARVTAAIDHFVRDRFFHGPSFISFHQNWLAWMAGIFWTDLRIPVLPDEILQHRRGICNQQAIVFMEMLKRSGIHYGAVLMGWRPDSSGSLGHFAVTARVDGRWLYFDTDQEAETPGVPVARVVDGSALPKLYSRKPTLLANMRYAAAHGGIRLDHFDRYPAPRGGLFQMVTEWLSAWGWLIFGLLAAAFFRPRVLRPLRAVLQPA